MILNIDSYELQFIRYALRYYYEEFKPQFNRNQNERMQNMITKLEGIEKIY